jgi:hypothetical protein
VRKLLPALSGALSPAMMLLTLLAAPAALGATFSDVTLGQAGLGGFNLGVFATGPTTLSASNSGTSFSVNMGLASGASTNFSGGGTLTGILYQDPGATVQGNIASQFNVNGGIVSQSLAQAVTDVRNAAMQAQMLTADQTLDQVGGSALTIFATGAVNGAGGRNTVVNLTSINITNSSKNLTINGGLNDFFIFNVAEDVVVTNGAIQTTGGIPASHILFNVLGTGDSVKLSNGSSLLTGTFLAPNVGQKITLSPGTVNGSVIGYQIQTSSGPTVTGLTFVPEPGTFGLLALGLGGLALAGRRRP